MTTATLDRCTCLLPVALMDYRHAVNCPANPAPPSWTCPDCGESATGTSRARRVARRVHARRHGVAAPRPSAPDPARRTLRIPAAPATRRRVR